MSMHRATIFRVVSLAVLIGLAVAPAVVAGKSYGEGVSGKKTIPIAKLLAKPDKYVDEVVRVEGVINAVCPKRGCWMSLASDKEEFNEIRIKVDDGVIVFPMEAKGRHAVAEGVFTKVEMTMEQTLSYKEHHAEEHGEEFDASTVTEPMTYYQIKGTGAVID